MAYSDFPHPNGSAGTRGFDSPGPGFTGQPRDCPGPVERAGNSPFLQVPLPAVSHGNAALSPEPETASPDPHARMEVVAPGMEQTTLPVLPEDAAFSLRQWSEAILQSGSPAALLGAPSPPESPGLAPAQVVSLEALADQLSARFISHDPAAPGVQDLLEKPDPVHLKEPTSPVLEEGRTLPEPTGPSAPPAQLPSSPAGIRAAAGLLSNPPRSVPARHQGDVFFLDHPASSTASVAGSLLAKDDFPGLLLETDQDDPGQPEIIRQDPTGAKWDSLLPDKADPDTSLPVGLSLAADSPPPAAIPAFTPLPAAALPPPLPSVEQAAFASEEAGGNGGLGLIPGGVGLLLAGIILACRLPLLWLDHAGSRGWDRSVLESSMLFHACGALLALVAGAGSLMQSRAAIHLTLAAGWLAVFLSALLLGIAGFLLGSEADWQLEPFGATLLLASLLLPLGYLLCYEKFSLGDLDSSGVRPPPGVPQLMVLLSALTVLVGAVSFLLFHPAVPLPNGSVITGSAAQAGWGGIALLAALAAICAWCRYRAAWWLLLLVVLGVLGTISVSALAGIPAWSTFLTALGRPEGKAPGLLWAPALGLAPLILLLVLAMSRRSFFPPPSSP